MSSFCEPSFAPALTTIATAMGGLLRANCVTGTLADRDRDPANGVQPDCAVTDHVPDGSGTGTVDSVVPECAKNGHTPPCWSLVPPSATANCPPNSNVLDIDRLGVTPAANARVSIQCSICTPGATDTAAGCP